MKSRFQPMASAKVYTKKPEDTAKHIAILEKHLEKGPVLTSVKWDGWRMFEYAGNVLCRSMDPPKNLHTRAVMKELFADMKARTKLVGIDGEAIAGDIMSPNAMQTSSSLFNSIDKKGDFTFMVFDSYQYADEPFVKRLDMVRNAVEILKGDWPFLRYTMHEESSTIDEIMEKLSVIEQAGGEGLMGRDPKGRYKIGRSTMNEGLLWALKPYADGECVIESIHEMMSNQNGATINSLGHTKRSGHKENMVPKGTFGYAVCRGLDPEWPETFRIGMGPGLNDALRAEIWRNPQDYVGGVLKYKYQAIGCVDRPRQPKWMGMRGKEDLAKA